VETTRRSFIIGAIAAPFIVRAASLDALSFVGATKIKLFDYAIEMQQPYHYTWLPGIGKAQTGDIVEYVANFTAKQLYWRRRGERIWKRVED
jgi:hypothetical protein